MKKKKKQDPWECGGGYGWMEMNPRTMAVRLQDATIKLGERIEELKPDALAYCGHSGAAFAFIAGVFHQLPIINVRKDGEESHGTHIDSNSTKPIRSYIIVDDFICSGSTVKHIVRSINEAADKYDNARPDCLGIFLYSTSWSPGRLVHVDDECYEVFV